MTNNIDKRVRTAEAIDVALVVESFPQEIRVKLRDALCNIAAAYRVRLNRAQLKIVAPPGPRRFRRRKTERVAKVISLAERRAALRVPPPTSES